MLIFKFEMNPMENVNHLDQAVLRLATFSVKENKYMSSFFFCCYEIQTVQHTEKVKRSDFTSRTQFDSILCLISFWPSPLCYRRVQSVVISVGIQIMKNKQNFFLRF